MKPRSRASDLPGQRHRSDSSHASRAARGASNADNQPVFKSKRPAAVSWQGTHAWVSAQIVFDSQACDDNGAIFAHDVIVRRSAIRWPTRACCEVEPSKPHSGRLPRSLVGPEKTFVFGTKLLGRFTSIHPDGLSLDRPVLVFVGFQKHAASQPQSRWGCESLCAHSANQTASSPRSPVRIRIASSMPTMKILPSPMRPVLAVFSIDSITWFTWLSAMTSSILTFGTKSTT